MISMTRSQILKPDINTKQKSHLRAARIAFSKIFLNMFRITIQIFSFLQTSILEAPLYLLRESRYVRLANTMLRVLRNARIPLFLCRKSNHIFTVWQHMVLLVIRQYQGKSYRMFSEWLVEAYYLRTFLQLSHIPHFTTLQKFTERISGTY